MATPQEKLAASLKVLSEFQNNDGMAVISPGSISRMHKDRLADNGFIQEVIRGWYISTRPGERPGDTSSWYPSYWYFISIYFRKRFQDDWCLSPEQSLSIHSGNTTVPKQLLVRSQRANNNKTNLLHDTSLFELKVDALENIDIVEMDGLNLISLPVALIKCSSDFYKNHPIDARTALLSIKDSSEILDKLLSGGHSLIAGRIAGAFRNIDRGRIADDILRTMKMVGYDVREVDPFQFKLPELANSRETSPYVNRIKLMWHQMRQVVLDEFPKPPGLPVNTEGYLKDIDETFTTDAYHSLSIEGYRVTVELIEKVRTGAWNPENDRKDKEHKDALAARGYWQAFQAVKESIVKILKGDNSGDVTDRDYGYWYQELFAPSVVAGIIKASDLAGFRNSNVIISGSMHIPPGHEAVRDTIPVLFDLLKEEPEPSVKAVLGHFIFVFIHPYRDGNGRISRFLMNAHLASGGYPWTVVTLDKKEEYMRALEKASTKQDIYLFTKLIAGLVQERLES